MKAPAASALLHHDQHSATRITTPLFTDYQNTRLSSHFSRHPPNTTRPPFSHAGLFIRITTGVPTRSSLLQSLPSAVKVDTLTIPRLRHAQYIHPIPRHCPLWRRRKRRHPFLPAKMISTAREYCPFLRLHAPFGAFGAFRGVDSPYFRASMLTSRAAGTTSNGESTVSWSISVRVSTLRPT